LSKKLKRAPLHGIEPYVLSFLFSVTVGMHYIFALDYAQIRCADTSSHRAGGARRRWWSLVD